MKSTLPSLHFAPLALATWLQHDKSSNEHLPFSRVTLKMQACKAGWNDHQAMRYAKLKTHESVALCSGIWCIAP